jgi:hypothetical protein
VVGGWQVPVVVCVHGIRQQVKGEQVELQEWLPALRDGLRRVGAAGRAVLAGVTDATVACAFYGDLFRPPGESLAVGVPFLSARDATPFDAELLDVWWRAAADCDLAVSYPDDETLVRTPRSVQAGLRALSRSRFFAGLGERALLFDLAQVRRYLTEPQLRADARDRVSATVDADTRVIVAHSLGSVVAYEALAAHPEWTVRALVTLGSPLGIRNLIFDRLEPAPEPFPASGQPPGRWPGSITAWTNIADRGDVVALVEDLRPLFGSRVSGHVVHNGAAAHSVVPYLTAPETGRAVAEALTDASRDGREDARP